LVLATGGSAIKAVEVLKESGVPEEKIIFINLVLPPFCVSYAGTDVRGTMIDIFTGGPGEVLRPGAEMQGGE